MSASLALLPEAAVALDRRGTILEASPPTVKMFQHDPVGSGHRPARRRVPWVFWGGDRGCRVRSARAGRAAGGLGAPTASRSALRRQRPRARRPLAAACCARSTASVPSSARRGVRPYAARDGVFNTDGEYVRVNAALCALLGRRSDELSARRDQEFTHPDDRQRDRRRLAHPAGRDQHVADREAVRPPRRLGGVGDRQPHVLTGRRRKPGELGRPVPGHHRAAPAWPPATR